MLYLFDSICCELTAEQFLFLKIHHLCRWNTTEKQKMKMRKPSEWLFQCFFGRWDWLSTGNVGISCSVLLIWHGRAFPNLCLSSCTSKPLPASCDWYAAWMGSKDPVSSYHCNIGSYVNGVACHWTTSGIHQFIWWISISQFTNVRTFASGWPDFLHLTLSVKSLLHARQLQITSSLLGVEATSGDSMAVARAASKLCLFFSTASTQEVKIVSLRTASDYHIVIQFDLYSCSWLIMLIAMHFLSSIFPWIYFFFCETFMTYCIHPPKSIIWWQYYYVIFHYFSIFFLSTS